MLNIINKGSSHTQNRTAKSLPGQGTAKSAHAQNNSNVIAKSDRSGLSPAAFSEAAQEKISLLRQSGKLLEAQRLSHSLDRFEKSSESSVYETYRNSDSEIRYFIQEHKKEALAKDPDFQKARVGALQRVNAELNKALQGAVPGDLSRLATLHTLDLVEKRSVLNLDYGNAETTAHDRKTLKNSKGETLQDVVEGGKSKEKALTLFGTAAAVTAAGAALVAPMLTIVGGLGIGTILGIFAGGATAGYTGVIGAKFRIDHLNKQSYTADKWSQKITEMKSDLQAT